MPATVAGIHLGPDTHANRPAANASGLPIGALYICTDHDIIYKTDGSTWSNYWTGAGATWTDVEADHDLHDHTGVPGVGAGGGDDPVADILGAPTTAFEFDSSSLVGLTLLGSAPTAEDADTTIPGHYYVHDYDAGNNVVGRYAAAPSAPFTAITKVSDMAVSAQFNRAGMFIGEPTPGDFDFLANTFNGALQPRLEAFTSSSSGGGFVAQLTGLVHAAPLWLCIRVNSSSDVDYLTSYNGRIWSPLTLARNPSAMSSIGSVGMAIAAHNAANPGGAAFDYLRIWNSALSLPGVAD